ncbi:uncharacterized protein [Aristolochia californica]|uniref:uncharacterized protein isoform X2 n=1 Tax=Aristolochia californica TaxID=171875 RepID=UPI0035DA202D
MAEEQEALFHSYPCEVYYVQSPSIVSHSNSPDCRIPDSALLSPFPLGTAYNATNINTCQEVSRFMLSRYSSSRGSNNSFLREKKIGYDLRSQENGDTEPQTGVLVEYGEGEQQDDEDGDVGRKLHGSLSFSYSSAWYCVCFQMLWRFLISGIREFALGEGVDGSGVTTKMLTSNCSIDLEIDNRSKFFGLNIRPPLIDMAFGRLNFAATQGPRLYVPSDSLVTFRLFVATKNKPMYGAGRAMEDMLQSGKGLPLEIHMRLSSNIRVVWNLIRPQFHHRVQCLLFLDRAYDRKHRTQSYNSTCTIISHA